MFEEGNLVTLKKADQYDGKTLVTTEDIGEIVDVKTDEGTVYVVAFQDMVDSEGVTPLVWAKARELTLYQI